MAHTPCLLDRYAAHLPIGPRTPRLTLGEGSTPLVRAPSLERETGIDEVWLKIEGANPTGSFKDRGMVVAVAKAHEGVFAEPASAAAVAGLKDPDTARDLGGEIVEVEATAEVVMGATRRVAQV